MSGKGRSEAGWAAQRKRSREWKQQARKDGRCISCGNPAKRAGLCDHHLKKKAECAADLYRKRKAANKCTECGKNTAWIGKSLRCYKCCIEKAEAKARAKRK